MQSKKTIEEEVKKVAEEARKFFAPEIPATGMLGKAKGIVDERMEKYGVPTESWTRIGRMWGAYLDIDDIPAEVCLQMMTLVKKIRERYEHNPDNWVDDVGYVDCAHRVTMAKRKAEHIEEAAGISEGFKSEEKEFGSEFGHDPPDFNADQ